MDPLSHVLAQTSILSARPIRMEASGRFALHYDPHVAVRFGRVDRGQLWVCEDGGRDHRVMAGDCFVFAAGTSCLISNAPKMEAVDGEEVCRTSEQGVARIGAGDELVVEGGMIELDRMSSHLLLDLLPAVIVIRADDEVAEEVRAALARFFVEARSDQLGASLVASHLGQLICLAALRSVLHGDPRRVRGWLAALDDPVIGEAVRRMHAAPGRLWTVAELAEISHMARSSFAVRFRALAGEPPLAHALALRMRLAGHQLRTTDRSIASIGEELGYSSDAAFSRAFKRCTGVAPRAWRHAVTTGTDAPDSMRTVSTSPDGLSGLSLS